MTIVNPCWLCCCAVLTMKRGFLPVIFISKDVYGCGQQWTSHQTDNLGREKLLRILFGRRSPGLFLREVTHISEQRRLTLSLGQDTQISDWKEMPCSFSERNSSSLSLRGDTLFSPGKEQVSVRCLSKVRLPGLCWEKSPNFPRGLPWSFSERSCRGFCLRREPLVLLRMDTLFSVSPI